MNEKCPSCPLQLHILAMDKALDQLFGADPADETTTRNERGVMFIKNRTEAPGFPKGWYREEVIRSGASVMHPAQRIIFYYSPDGRKFQSKADLTRFFGSRLDLTNFDFKSGKLLPNYSAVGVKKSSNMKVGPVTRNGAASNLSPANLQRFLEPPVRQCTCIYNQKVKVIETCGQNVCKELKDIPKIIGVAVPRNLKPKPVQVYWTKRLEGPEACDMNMDLREIRELPKGFKAATSVVSESAALASLTAAIYNATHQSVTTAENQPLLGQYTHIEKIKQNPAVYVNPYQPLTVSLKVTSQLIEEQELQVQRLRDDLASLLAKQQTERSF